MLYLTENYIHTNFYLYFVPTGHLPCRQVRYIGSKKQTVSIPVPLGTEYG